MIFSPSNMMTYRSCPLRFMGQSVTKDIVWKPSAQKERGTEVHKFMERLMKMDGAEWGGLTFPEGVDKDFTRQCAAGLRRHARENGMAVFTEKELCVDSKLRSCDWWDENAFMRAKADCLCISPDKAVTPVLIDFKTGKKWDNEDFQLRVEALLVSLLFGSKSVRYEYWYVDSGEKVEGVVKGSGDVRDIYALVAKMTVSLRNNDFPPRKNKFCRWCDYHETAKCPR